MTKDQRGGLAEQIRLAQKAMKEWPKWMRETAYFAGTDHPAPRVPTCRHCGGEVPCGC